MPEISVIVPVYNAEKYISRCIDSILSQRIPDFELLLIDDGSTDNSGALCDEYAEKDSRIKVFHQANKGASAARNTGIDIAEGDWIVFVDADDWVDSEYLESLYEHVKSSDGEMFVFQGLIKKHQQNISLIQLDCSDIDITHNADLLFEKINLFKYCGPCCKILKKEYLKNIRFNENIIAAEDYDFLIRYLTLCNMVKLSSQVHYFYEHHNNSVSCRLYSFENELSGLKQLKQSFCFFLNIKKSNMAELQFYKIRSYYTGRLLYSVYSERKSKRHTRLENLKRIPVEDILLFKKYNIPETLFLRIVKFLFVRRFFSILDLLYKFRECLK